MFQLSQQHTLLWLPACLPPLPCPQMGPLKCEPHHQVAALTEAADLLDKAQQQEDDLFVSAQPELKGEWEAGLGCSKRVCQPACRQQLLRHLRVSKHDQSPGSGFHGV
jgi:hypothetical protein